MTFQRAAAGLAAAATLLGSCARHEPMIPEPRAVVDRCRSGAPNAEAVRRVVAAVDDGNYLTGNGNFFVVEYLRNDGGVIAEWEPETLKRSMPKAAQLYAARFHEELTGRVAVPDRHELTLGERWISTEVRRGNRLGWIDTLSHDKEDVCIRI
jgi:hypothetical protein